MLSRKALSRSLELKASSKKNSSPYGPTAAGFTGAKGSSQQSKASPGADAPKPKFKYRAKRDPNTDAVTFQIDE
jgi:hypothetical protein